MNQDIKKQTLSVLIAQAGLKLSVKGFWVRSVLFALIFAAILKIIGLNPVVIGAGFLTGLLGLPKLFLKMKAGKRQKLFLKEHQ